MSSFEKRLLIGLGLLVLLLSVLEAAVPEPTDWTPSYSRHKDTPYGSRLVYESVSDLFPQVHPVDGPFSVVANERLEEGPAAPVVHLVVAGTYSQSDANTRSLLSLAAKGDHFLIAANTFQGLLADTLNLVVDMEGFGMREDTSDLRFIGEPRIVDGVFRYAHGYPGAYFTRYDTLRSRVLAVDGASHPVLLQMTWGKGRLVLCTAPHAFTNFNLLKNDNGTALAAMLSALPAIPLYWHEYHNANEASGSTPLRFLLSQPSLRWAWMLTLALTFLFILVRARREQRAIPVVVPLRNATRELMHTLGRLHWGKGDHADMAQKMITNFKEDLRQRTYLHVFAYDDATAAHIAFKTGRSKSDVAALLNTIAAAESSDRLSEIQLLKLSEQINELRRSIP